MNLPVMAPGLDRALVSAWCRHIDEGPWSSLAAGERITFPNPELITTMGFAAALTEHALGYAERMGYTVIPSCSYVERYLERRQRHLAKS